MIAPDQLELLATVPVPVSAVVPSVGAYEKVRLPLLWLMVNVPCVQVAKAAAAHVLPVPEPKVYA